MLVDVLDKSMTPEEAEIAEERIAICHFDGGLTIDESIEVAFKQIVDLRLKS